ncbi:hypothetical protein D3C87_1681710 [compost metagenome]
MHGGNPEALSRIETLVRVVLPRAGSEQDAVGQATAIVAGLIQREAFTMSYSDAFFLLAIIMLLATLASLTMRRPQLPGRFL